MKDIISVNRHELFSLIKEKHNSYNRILDVGCGIRPQTLGRNFMHICVEPHKEYITFLRKSFLPNHHFLVRNKFLFLNKTTDFLIDRFPRKSVDAVFMLDVIEHLDKEYGKRVIQALEEIAVYDVILFTPLGYVEQLHPDGKDAWGMDGGKWQEHKSGWDPTDFPDDWTFYVCKDFHDNDNLGNEYDEAEGAFFAVKSLKVKKRNNYIIKRFFLELSNFFFRARLLFLSYQS